jgi:hypothetical protein
MELESSEAGLSLLGAGQGEHRELGLNGPDPCIGRQWLFGLFKSRGLHGIEMLIFSDSRLAVDVFPHKDYSAAAEQVAAVFARVASSPRFG